MSDQIGIIVFAAAFIITVTILYKDDFKAILRKIKRKK
ncbi:hypothetical protein FHS86_003492 [Roseimarinus sediminis]